MGTHSKYPTPWTVVPDDENCRVVLRDADNVAIVYITDVIRGRAIEDAQMIADMANENAELRAQLAASNVEKEVWGAAGKPPLGLRPKFVAAQARAMEILDAMRRYAERGYEVPYEWREELEELMNDPGNWIHKCEEERKD